MTERTHYLLDTTDAMIWAEEFCRIFHGATIVQDAKVNPNFTGTQVDEGTMVGWFANAMQVGESFYRERHNVPIRSNDGVVEVDVEALPEEILVAREILVQMIDQFNRKVRVHLGDVGRRFELHRDVDETGISGTGVVAEGMVTRDGVAMMRWLTEWPSSVCYYERGIEAVEALHGHNGKTRIVFLDE